MKVRTRVQVGVTVALLTAVSVIGAGASSAAPPEQALGGWPRQLGAAGHDMAAGAAVSAAGDVYVVGSTDGVFPGFDSAGSDDVFLARYTNAGVLKWVRQFGTPTFDHASGVVVSGSSIYVTGYTGGTFAGATSHGGNDVFLARFDTNGNRKWVRQLGTGGSDVANGLAVSGSMLYVAGYTSGEFPGATAAGGFDAFLARVDSNGNQKWVRQLGTAGSDVATGVAVSGSNVFISGTTNDAFTGFTPLGGTDAFVARYDTTGNKQWVRQLGTAGDDPSFAVAAISGGVVLAGYTEDTFTDVSSAGGSDAYLARYDVAGGQTWVRQFGTAGSDQATGLAVSGSGIFLIGSTTGAFADFAQQGGSDLFAARYDSTGTRAWVRQFGTAENEYPSGVAVRSGNANGGGVILAGSTGGTVWGQTSGGGYDTLVAAFLR